ncbi:MAG: leucine-rich repeat domain-containing protein [Bacteroidales bacterium]|nr:leucine-rich repeat domain-containing protein [Bacteroidales bacterium]
MQEFMFKPVEENGTYCAISYKGDNAEVTIPEMYCGHPVTVLFDDLFKGHKEITTVHIPDSVREIGGFVFDGCSSLKSIVLPSSLENMWQYAFVRSSIEEIRLPEKLRYVAPFAFKDCKNLRKVVCNDALEEICCHAFEGCDRQMELICKDTVKISSQAWG